MLNESIQLVAKKAMVVAESVVSLLSASKMLATQRTLIARVIGCLRLTNGMHPPRLAIPCPNSYRCLEADHSANPICTHLR